VKARAGAPPRRRHIADTLKALKLLHTHLARGLGEATVAEWESVADQLHAATQVLQAKREEAIRVA
jgi:hypothetical protein